MFPSRTVPLRLAAVAAVLGLAACASGESPTFVAGPATPSPAAPGPATATAPPSGAAPSRTPRPAQPSATPSPRRTPSAGPARAACAGFPADSVWRADVSKLPVHRSSATYVNSIGAAAPMHPDFGAGRWEGAPIGIPVTVVRSGQRRVPVSFEYADESDPGPYPIPADATVEGGPDGTGDRHVIVHDPAACKVYELFAARPAGGGWRAGSGAVFDLRSNRLRPAGWTSADAAGLSVFAGLVRYEEVAAGRIGHAVRITVPRSRDSYVWPARHAASASSDPALPPMGLRLRLKASVDTSAMPRQARIIAEAMQRYGVIVADNGSPWYLSGAPDERWSNSALRVLKNLRGSDFEAVDTAGLMADRNSGAVRAR
ncbi:hypothetical protein K7640_06900 [Micromonospora sp. PLK6-60]|uniref:hypothetical protein n=1 Tax=Micromonospora sp. PLK6-60 TaxID=2873383 RepID=UPI001CA610D5|nr:hypothetical protein [Micromonospora sp. PLK6-60]MBY8871572.1 hypothetical protein [Micromonospora sp. PLK6-60]